MSVKIKTGTKGENLAADFLVEKGFEILARNFRFRKAEIDLIVRRENWLIFVEVKTRRSNYYGNPEEFVDEFKARNMYNAAEEYIFKIDWNGHVRFDVVSVRMSNEDGPADEIVHFEDAINL